jgi:DNA-binding response OmpR family regulator
MVTAVGDEPEKLGALRYGADDYVVKPYSPKEVVARVHAILRRSLASQASAVLLRHGPLRVDLVSVVASIEGRSGDEPKVLDLTPTEFNLLATLLRTPHKAFTRSELLEVCQAGRDASDRLIDAHVHNLRRKLGACGVTDILVTVRSVGYRFQR